MASRASSRSRAQAISGAALTTSLYTLRCVNNFRFSPVVVSDEVSTAIREGRGVVALETTIVVHGLPSPINLEVARECETSVRKSGADARDDRRAGRSRRRRTERP